MLKLECEVVAMVRDGYALLKTARALRPDIVVVDITMSLLNGIRFVRYCSPLVPLRPTLGRMTIRSQLIERIRTMSAALRRGMEVFIKNK